MASSRHKKTRMAMGQTGLATQLPKWSIQSAGSFKWPHRYHRRQSSHLIWSHRSILEVINKLAGLNDLLEFASHLPSSAFIFHCELSSSLFTIIIIFRHQSYRKGSMTDEKNNGPIGEDFFLEAKELDTLNIICTLSIFIANILAVLYLLWCLSPLIKEYKADFRSQSVYENSLSASAAPHKVSRRTGKSASKQANQS